MPASLVMSVNVTAGATDGRCARLCRWRPWRRCLRDCRDWSPPDEKQSRADRDNHRERERGCANRAPDDRVVLWLEFVRHRLPCGSQVRRFDATRLQGLGRPASRGSRSSPRQTCSRRRRRTCSGEAANLRTCVGRGPVRFLCSKPSTHAAYIHRGWSYGRRCQPIDHDGLRGVIRRRIGRAREGDGTIASVFVRLVAPVQRRVVGRAFTIAQQAENQAERVVRHDVFAIDGQCALEGSGRAREERRSSLGARGSRAVLARSNRVCPSSLMTS